MWWFPWFSWHIVTFFSRVSWLQTDVEKKIKTHVYKFKNTPSFQKIRSRGLKTLLNGSMTLWKKYTHPIFDNSEILALTNWHLPLMESTRSACCHYLSLGVCKRERCVAGTSRSLTKLVVAWHLQVTHFWHKAHLSPAKLIPSFRSLTHCSAQYRKARVLLARPV